MVVEEGSGDREVMVVNVIGKVRLKGWSLRVSGRKFK